MLRVCSSVRRKPNLLVPINLLCLAELRRLQASGGSGILQTCPPPVESLLRATPVGISAPPRGELPPHRGKQHWGSSEYHPAAYLVCRPMVGESYCPSLRWCQHHAQCSTKNPPTRWTGYPWSWISLGCPPPYDHPNCGSPEHAGLRDHSPSLQNSHLRPFTRNPLSFLTFQGR